MLVIYAFAQLQSIAVHAYLLIAGRHANSLFHLPHHFID